MEKVRVARKPHGRIRKTSLSLLSICQGAVGIDRDDLGINIVLLLKSLVRIGGRCRNDCRERQSQRQCRKEPFFTEQAKSVLFHVFPFFGREPTNDMIDYILSHSFICVNRKMLRKKGNILRFSLGEGETSLYSKRSFWAKSPTRLVKIAK